MVTLDIDKLPDLPGPYEILELADGQSIEIRPIRWEIGKAEIQPRDGRPPKVIRILRVHVDPAEKPTLPHYWDITSQHLVAGLVGQLEARRGRPARYRITKHGEGPSARFTLEVLPG